MSKRIVIDPANPNAAARAAFGDMNATLESWLDKVPAESKPFIANLKATVDAALAKLAAQPTDQVPAAQEANYALRNLAEAFSYMGEIADRAMAQVDGILKQFSPKIERLNELDVKLEKKELLTKEESETAANSAVDAALAKERQRIKLFGDRRSVLCEANLPVPPSDSALDGDETAFAVAKKTVAERHKVLVEGGMIEQLNQSDVAELCYGPQKDFDRYLKLAEKAGKPVSNGEPMAGGGKISASTAPTKLVI